MYKDVFICVTIPTYLALLQKAGCVCLKKIAAKGVCMTQVICFSKSNRVHFILVYKYVFMCV